MILSNLSIPEYTSSRIPSRSSMSSLTDVLTYSRSPRSWNFAVSRSLVNFQISEAIFEVAIASVEPLTRTRFQGYLVCDLHLTPQRHWQGSRTF
jgi:hypothetical protein